MEKSDNPVPIKLAVPNSTATLVMGILSIIMCWCWGVIGLTLGIVALAVSSKSKKEYLQNPDKYTESSYKNLNAGRVCAIIGICLAGLWIVIVLVQWIFWGVTFGTLMTRFPWDSLNI